MQDNDPSPGRARRWVLALTSLAAFIIALDGLVVATALTSIQQSLGASLHELEWSVNGYNLSFAVLLMVGAAVGERFGRRRFFLIGMAIFVLASIACALATSITGLIVARVVQGAGAAFVMPLGMALLGAAFPPEIRGKALGTFGAVTGLAIISGPVVGGAIAQGLDWTWIFWINLPIGLVIIPLGMALLKESRGGDARIDGPGVLLMVGAAFGVTWALMRTSDLGWSGGEVLLSFGAAALLTIGFIVWQRLARAPMLPPRLFAHRAFSAGVAATFLHYGALYATLFFIAQFLQVGQGFSPLDAGLRMLPWTATLFFVAPIAGNLLNRTGERPLVLAGLLLQAIGLGTIALTAGPEMSFFSLAIPQIIAGVGASLAIPSMQSAVMGAVSENEMGKATGAFGVAEFLGGVAGIALAASVFATTGSFVSEGAFSGGFSNAMWTAAALSFLGAMAAAFLPSRAAVRAAQPATL